jgi:hypothetical protein
VLVVTVFDLRKVKSLEFVFCLIRVLARQLVRFCPSRFLCGGLALSVWMGQSLLASPLLSDPAVDAYNVRVGTQTFAGLYQFGTNTMLVETAQAINEMGSDTIKLYLGNSYPRQYHYNLGQDITNLLTLVRDDPSCRKVFDMPFRNFVAWAYPFANGDAPFTDGNYSPTEQANDYRELYALAQYLLTNYNNSGKTFYLGHWEGDGYLDVNNWSTNPSPAVIQAMIGWENLRQKAIDDAKAGLNFTNVNVFYYAEVNRVRDAMVNGPNNNQRVVNMVLPYVTNLDYLSYSSYDAMNLDAAGLYSTLDYIKSKLPANKTSPALGQRMWIGEYGWGGSSTEAQEPANRAYIQRLLSWGPRFILFWEIYNNETNRNFCLIDSNGVKVASYYLHQRFINRARLNVAQFKEINGRLPNDSEFAAIMNPWLNQPFPPAVNVTISNLPPTLTNNSAVLSAQIAPGVYGQDQASVWLYSGHTDGGTTRSAWDSAIQLGFDTNFNPATFSTTLQGLVPQTNYYYRFYATNSAGEVWAPTTGWFSTDTLDPNEFHARTQVQLPGYHRAEGLANFPVLLELSTNIPGFSYRQFASPNGSDLRLTDADGLRLIPFEIDEWNPAGTSFVWVQVPQLNGTNTSIWAYWGNPLATNLPVTSTNGTTWSAIAQSVWHLKESGLPYSDSVQQHPIKAGVSPPPSPGMIGHGLAFDGSSQYLDAGVLDVGGSFTVSAWIRVDPSATGIQTICANKKGGWNSDGFAFYINSYLTTDHKVLFESGDGTNGVTASTFAQAVTSGVWHHIAAVVDAAAGLARLYVDGVDQTQSSQLQSDFNRNADLNFGRFTDGAYYFKGALDELRIEPGTRSLDWIWAEWASAFPNSGLGKLGGVNLQPASLLLSLTGSGGLAAWAGNGVGLALYTTTNLGAASSWMPLTNLPALISNQWQVPFPLPSNGSQFFRLQPQ